MATAYEKAAAERVRLESEKARIDMRLSEIETFLKIFREFEEATAVAASSTSAPEATQQAESPSDIAAAEKMKGVTQKEFNECLRSILLRFNRPLSTKQIRQGFDSDRVIIGGEHPDKNFYSKLWQATKDGGFVRIPTNKLVWFADTSYPEAGYIAPQFRENDEPKKPGLDFSEIEGGT